VVAAEAEATAAAAAAAAEAAAAAAAAEATAAALQSARFKPPASVAMLAAAETTRVASAACSEANDAAQLALQTYDNSKPTAEAAAAAATAAADAAAEKATAATTAAAESGGSVGEEVVSTATAKAEEAKASAALAAADLALVIAALDALAASAASSAAAVAKAKAAHDEINNLATRTLDEEERGALDAAATMIQAHIRAFIAKDVYGRQRASILFIQKAAKGYLAFTRYARVKKSSAHINRILRGYSARQKVREMRSDIRKEIHATLLIQSCLRGRIARKRATVSSEEKATCHCGRVATGEMLSCAQCCEFYHALCVRASRWRVGPEWNKAGRVWTCPRCLTGSVPVGSGAAEALAAAAGAVGLALFTTLFCSQNTTVVDDSQYVPCNQSDTQE
jgi:hypothetical protein